uniref:Uncharacterized protein n=1 Tax=Mycena chlorophos TaxID=658473 RepID=A0ABQ0LPH3_MYCCL|nr:predicted protein [Mycena chlorophos]
MPPAATPIKKRQPTSPHLTDGSAPARNPSASSGVENGASAKVNDSSDGSGEAPGQLLDGRPERGSLLCWRAPEAWAGQCIINPIPWRWPGVKALDYIQGWSPGFRERLRGVEVLDWTQLSLAAALRVLDHSYDAASGPSEMTGLDAAMAVALSHETLSDPATPRTERFSPWIHMLHQLDRFSSARTLLGVPVQDFGDRNQLFEGYEALSGDAALMAATALNNGALDAVHVFEYLSGVFSLAADQVRDVRDAAILNHFSSFASSSSSRPETAARSQRAWEKSRDPGEEDAEVAASSSKGKGKGRARDEDDMDQD